MKIALVITGLQMGGAENQVCDLADTFFGLGHEVMIISLLNITDLKPRNIDIEIKILNLKFYNFINCLYNFNLIIKSFKPDVVHANLFHAIIFSRILNLFISVPKLISTHHGMKETTFFRRFLFLITDFLTDLNTNVSESSSNDFLESFSGTKAKTIVVNNGINFHQFKFRNHKRVELRKRLNILESTTVLLAVGRLVWEKNYLNLLKSFNLCLIKKPNLQLIIIGEGPMRQELELYATKMNISNKINFLGKKDDAKFWYSAADIFINSSKREGFGLAVIEAMASKRLIVMTKCGISSKFHKNLISLSETVNYKSISNAILDCLLKLEKDKKKITDLNYKFVEKHFSLDQIALKWINIYTNN